VTINTYRRHLHRAGGWAMQFADLRAARPMPGVWRLDGATRFDGSTPEGGIYTYWNFCRAGNDKTSGLRMDHLRSQRLEQWLVGVRCLDLQRTGCRRARRTSAAPSLSCAWVVRMNCLSQSTCARRGLGPCRPDSRSLQKRAGLTWVSEPQWRTMNLMPAIQSFSRSNRSRLRQNLGASLRRSGKSSHAPQASASGFG
jgi:hypothetical protein